MVSSLREKMKTYPFPPDHAVWGQLVGCGAKSGGTLPMRFRLEAALSIAGIVVPLLIWLYWFAAGH
jgi:hypothetical protein